MIPHTSIHTIDGIVYTWDVRQLWKAAEDIPKELIKVDELQHLDKIRWFDKDYLPTLKNLAKHYQRARNSDLSYPIILDPNGHILDGAHRVLHCLLIDQPEILVVRLNKLPQPIKAIPILY